MPRRRISVVYASVALLCGLLGSLGFHASVSAQIEAAPATTVSPPQQMPVYGVPPNYPSTADPATAPWNGLTPGVSISTTPMAPGGLGSPQPLGNPTAAMASNTLGAPYGAPDAASAVSLVPPTTIERSLVESTNVEWQVLPDGLMYKSYLAGPREPRLGSEWLHQRNGDWLWSPIAGGRVGLVRLGTDDPLYPQGWQFDAEGAIFPRLDYDVEGDLIATDYRCGFLSTTRQGAWETKFGYYHVSSHLGDEYLLRHPGVRRINYVRNSLVFGTAFHATPGLRLYGEVGWTFHEDGGAKPWEFQLGFDWTASNEPTGFRGEPFLAVNGHLRQENDFGGNITVETGWLWRGKTGHTCRIGMKYFNGMSDQYEFYDQFEEQIGLGFWYDY